ncbi:MAG: D-hexose-6-phosphate mutarotase [bacterium]
MSLPDINQLNKRFGSAGRIAFRAGAGGLPVAALAGPHGACEVSLYGGQVLGYKPLGHAPVLFVSRKAWHEIGKPIRGGIPVCWPWFGAHPAEKNKPAHGFARLQMWSMLTAEYSAQMTDIKLGLCDSESTRALWPHAFDLTLRVILDTTLRVELTTRNCDKAPVTISEALHTYLLVRDVAHTTVLGLDGVRYFDALTGQEHAAQKGAVHVHGETDRVYHDTNPECRVDDAGLGRQIVVAKRNSHSTVVWNPWIEKSKRMSDFGADEYPQMLCVETANARQATLTLPPGEQHTMALSLRADLKTT